MSSGSNFSLFGINDIAVHVLNNNRRTDNIFIQRVGCFGFSAFERHDVVGAGPLLPVGPERRHELGRRAREGVFLFERVVDKVDQLPVLVLRAAHQLPVSLDDGARALVLEVEFAVMGLGALNGWNEALAGQGFPLLVGGGIGAVGEVHTGGQDVDDVCLLRSPLPGEFVLGRVSVGDDER